MQRQRNLMSMEGEVTSGLLVTADMKPQYKFVEVLIRYPTSWRVGKHWVRSRFAETAAREAKVWLNSFGLLSSESRKKRIEAMNLVDYGGCPLPLGNYAATLLHTKFVTLWLLWDDVAVEARNISVAEQCEQVVSVLGGGPLPVDADPFIAAWHSVGQGLSSVSGSVTPTFYQRFSASFGRWLQCAMEEKRIFQGDESSLEKLPLSFFIEQRVNTIGMYSEALFIELTCGFEFPEHIYSHPTFRSLVRLSGLLVGLSNEIVSVAKDAASADHWSNVVLIHQRQNRCGIQESFRYVVDLHDKAVEEYDLLASQSSLSSFVPTEWQERVSEFLQLLRLAIRGFAYWHSITPRYISRFVVEQNTSTAFRPRFVEEETS